MVLVPVPLGPTTDRAKARQGGGVTIVNGYVEITDGGKTGFSINTRPRLKLFADVDTEACRGGIYVNNYLYAVIGEHLWKISSGATATDLGIILGQQPVTFSVNRHAPDVQITITADTKNYVCSADVIVEVTDADLPSGVTSNCYINGRTVYGINDGSHYWSDEEDSTSINALNFAEAEREADQGVRVYTYGEDFWHFGTGTRETIRYTGESTNLFAPLLGAGQGEGDGLLAAFSPATVNGAVYWINDYGHVVASTGGKAEKVSNHEVDRSIEAAKKQGFSDQITGYTFGTEGHEFYVLRCSLWCWMLDTATGFWFQVKSYLSDTFRCGFAVKAFNKTLLLDATEGKIYEFTFDVQDDAGEACILQIETSPLNAFPEGYICDALHVDCQTGVGNAEGTTENEQDPQMLLQVSRDGGTTYGNSHSRSMGQQGKYNFEVRFNRLGMVNGNGMAFKLSMPDPVQKAVFQATASLRRLRSK